MWLKPSAQLAAVLFLRMEVSVLRKMSRWQLVFLWSVLLRLGQGFWHERLVAASDRSEIFTVSWSAQCWPGCGSTCGHRRAQVSGEVYPRCGRTTTAWSAVPGLGGVQGRAPQTAGAGVGGIFHAQPAQARSQATQSGLVDFRRRQAKVLLRIAGLEQHFRDAQGEAASLQDSINRTMPLWIANCRTSSMKR